MDSIWIVVFCLLILVILPLRRRRIAVWHRAVKNIKKKGTAQMETLAKQFLDKECIIYTVSDTYGEVRGMIREVNDGAMLLESKKGRQIINLEYVTRIQECPPKKSEN